MRSKPTVISLYSGAGGLDFGFEAAGFVTRVALEFDATCCRTLRGNRDWPVLEGDIHEFTSQRILAEAGLKTGEADVLIGGPPCQPFSKAGFWAHGEAKRLLDPRATTLGAYLRVLEETAPRCFLLENVEGLGFKGKDEGLRLILDQVAELNSRAGLDYEVSFSVLNAADYGVPQVRRRLFIVGIRGGGRFLFPNPTHSDPYAPDLLGLSPHMTCWDALHDLGAPNDDETRVSGKWADLLPTIPEGKNYLWHTDRDGGEPLFGWRRRYWSFLLKLAKDRPAWTIQAQPGPATGPFHWDSRRLTAAEMCRLQTFPDDVRIEGGLADAQRQLGNAVPSLLGEVLAREIARQGLFLDVSKDLVLLPERADRAPPPPRKPAPVPEKYLALKGDHAAHPGTGRGARASLR